MLYKEKEVKKEIIKSLDGLYNNIDNLIEDKRKYLNDDKGKYILMGMVAVKNEILMNIERIKYNE